MYEVYDMYDVTHGTSQVDSREPSSQGSPQLRQPIRHPSDCPNGGTARAPVLAEQYGKQPAPPIDVAAACEHLAYFKHLSSFVWSIGWIRTDRRRSQRQLNRSDSDGPANRRSPGKARTSGPFGKRR